MKEMIAIFDIDKNSNDSWNRYWNYRWNQKIWSFIEKNKYNFAMFFKKINDFDIETMWILKVFKFEMILIFWLNIEFIIEIKK